MLVVSAVAAADKPKKSVFTYWRMATEPQGSIMQSIIDKFRQTTQTSR